MKTFDAFRGNLPGPILPFLWPAIVFPPRPLRVRRVYGIAFFSAITSSK